MAIHAARFLSIGRNQGLFLIAVDVMTDAASLLLQCILMKFMGEGDRGSLEPSKEILMGKDVVFFLREHPGSGSHVQEKASNS